MKQYKMTIELLSDTLSGSGEGFGAIIDTDVQYDECGIPFISSKRIKGALRNSLSDLLDMPAIESKVKKESILEALFGKKGSIIPSSFEISNFFIEDYSQVKMQFEILKKEYPDIFSSEKILKTFTNIRTHTKVDKNGIAEDHSLRTIRVVNKGLRFHSDIAIDENCDICLIFLPLACANLRRIGTKRNRGFGKIICSIPDLPIKPSIDSLKILMESK